MDANLTGKLCTRTAWPPRAVPRALHFSVSWASTFSISIKSERSLELLFPELINVKFNSRIESFSPWRITYCDKERSKHQENQLVEATDEKERFPMPVWGLFLIFTLNGVGVAKSLSAEEEMFAMMDKYSFQSEGQIRGTTCSGTQTSITVILRRARITCRLKKKTSLHPFETTDNYFLTSHESERLGEGRRKIRWLNLLMQRWQLQAFSWHPQDAARIDTVSKEQQLAHRQLTQRYSTRGCFVTAKPHRGTQRKPHHFDSYRDKTLWDKTQLRKYCLAFAKARKPKMFAYN